MNYKPVSIIQLQKIEQSVKAKYKLEKPTYKVALAGGNTQIYQYDEKSILDASTPAEDVQKWNEYQSQQKEMQSEVNEKTTAYLFYAGIECEVSPEWIELQKWLGIDIPENQFDAKVMYITTELLKTPSEIKEAILEIMKLSARGVDKSAIKAAESMFSDTLP